MKLLSLFAALLLLTSVTAAQQAPASPAPQAPTKADDFTTIEGTVAALYDVISGTAGERNWKRFHDLFLPEARLIASGKNPQGQIFHRVMSPDDYQQHATPFFTKEGFFERGIANRIVRYGHIAHIFSTYESRHDAAGQPFARGINSIQLLNDGTRWWVVTILWDSESPEQPIPAEFLKSEDVH